MGSKFRATALFTLLILAGCNRGPKSTAMPPTEETPRDLVIVLESTDCFGTCPVYKLTISANGSVEFEGRHYVKKKGVVRATIPREQLKYLVAEFESVKYFSLQDHYVSKEDGCTRVWTDHPTVKTSITITGKTKSVEHYYGCEGPPVLTQLVALENKIGGAVNVSQWFDENNR